MKAYERLIKYTSFETGSDENCEKSPSSAGQMAFAEYLVSELKSLGIENAQVDEYGYVYAKIPANCADLSGKTIGFIAHMDTVSDVEYRNVKARVIESYDGEEIILNEEKNIKMPAMPEYEGFSLVVTDGTTILGADDKAGIAEIMTMAERLMTDKSLEHGEVAICFTPDEEIGRGTDYFDLKKFGADYAYTVDGGLFGEIEYENFNAINAKVTINGKNVHPGTAKMGGMKNANSIAFEFDSMLPKNERPEYTEGYEGFYHLTDIESSVEKAEMSYILRDPDNTKIKIKRAMFEKIAEFLNTKYGKGTVVLELKDSYANMAEKILPHFHLIENASRAIEMSGGIPKSELIRGGTDGVRLSFMGLPCPNLATGSDNHHGRFEFAVVEEMDMCVNTLVEITKAYK
ncbi:MAG: peptidase T [Clostridia bacterium]|nr:peptidase T [Clostridia bacterium]